MFMSPKTASFTELQTDHGWQDQVPTNINSDCPSTDISKKILVDNETLFPQFPPPHFWGQVTSFIEGRMKILHKEYLYRPTLGIFGRAPRFESRPGPHHPNASGAKERGDAKRHEMSHQLWDVGYCVWVSSIQRIPFAFAMFQCLEGFLKSSTLQPCNWPNQCCLGW